MRPYAITLRWTAAVLFAVYAAVIARLTLLPASDEHGIFAVLNRAMSLSDGRLTFSRAEILANIALFIPAGFLLAVAAGRTWVAIVLCVLGSAAIELAQQRYLPSRVPSVADVEHNGLGGVIGGVLAWPLAYWARTRTRRPAARPVTPTNWDQPVRLQPTTAEHPTARF